MDGTEQKQHSIEDFIFKLGCIKRVESIISVPKLLFNQISQDLLDKVCSFLLKTEKPWYPTVCDFCFGHTLATADGTADRYSRRYNHSSWGTMPHSPFAKVCMPLDGYWQIRRIINFQGQVGISFYSKLTSPHVQEMFLKCGVNTKCTLICELHQSSLSLHSGVTLITQHPLPDIIILMLVGCVYVPE